MAGRRAERHVPAWRPDARGRTSGFITPAPRCSFGMLPEDVIAASRTAVAAVPNWVGALPAATLASRSKLALYYRWEIPRTRKLNANQAECTGGRTVSSLPGQRTPTGLFSQYRMVFFRRRCPCSIHACVRAGPSVLVSFYVCTHRDTQRPEQTQGDKISKNHPSKS